MKRQFLICKTPAGREFVLRYPERWAVRRARRPFRRFGAARGAGEIDRDEFRDALFRIVTPNRRSILAIVIGDA